MRLTEQTVDIKFFTTDMRQLPTIATLIIIALMNSSDSDQVTCSDGESIQNITS